MRVEPRRAATLALAALLACCRSEPPPAPLSAPPIAGAAASPCRAGPDGAPLADRGIGGTGSPDLTADRGIGGTGSPELTADRGIGGTGIIGVITGFASVCLAGQEVALPPDVSVAVDQQPASPAILRAGQVAVVDAAGDPARLRARRILIRYEAVGVVDRIDGDIIRVAGQDVALTPQTWGTRPRRGDRVAVSGLRRGDGTVEATRIEPAPPGPVLVHGMLVEDAGSLRIGALPIRRDPAAVALVGNAVTVTGIIGPSGGLLPVSVVPDLLVTDPAAYFGPQVGVVLIEGFAVVNGGRLRLAPGFSAPAPGLQSQGPQRGVFRFERSDGALRAIGFGGRPAQAAPTPIGTSARFEPAPVPNRAIRGPANAPAGGRGNRARGRFGRDRNQGSPDATPSNANQPTGPSGYGPPGSAPPDSRER